MSGLAIDHLLDDKYRIVRLVGQGAWATVYEAINVRIQRRVALKVLNIELSEKPDLLARFRREAEAATQIESPFVVTMFDAGTLEDGRPYIVMEFLEGENLGKRLERVGQLTQVEAAGYAVHLLSGLADAHATGVLHRDIKPDNLVIVQSKTGEEILKLVDFGISKPNVARPEMLRMTKTDVLLGSPLYMSPEQARGTRHMDHRSDLYSVGVVLYESLTLTTPHAADNFNELMFKVALEEAETVHSRRRDIDPAFAAIIMRALAREPADRYQTAVDFRAAIVGWLEQRGAPLPPSPYLTSNIRVRAADSAPTLTLPRATPPLDGSLQPAVHTDFIATAVENPPRRVMPFVAGGLAVLLLAGAGVFFAAGRSPAAPPTTGNAPPEPVAALSIAPATASAIASAPASAAASTPPPHPADPPSASAPPKIVPAVAQPAFPKAFPSRPAASGRASAAPSAPSAPVAHPTPPAPHPTSSAVVEGRTLHTTF